MAQDAPDSPSAAGPAAGRARPSRLAAEFDGIVQSIYRAGAGLESWGEPLRRIAEASSAWATTLGAIDTRTNSLLFNYAAGPRPAAASAEYARTYCRIDPRIELLRREPVGKWVDCDKYFDEKFPERHRFFREFTHRYGSRYVYAVKLLEDDTAMIVMGYHRQAGNPLVDRGERRLLERLAEHLAAALAVQKSHLNVVERDALGFILLDRLRQPVILLDGNGNITFRSQEANALLERGDPLIDRNGVLACRDPESDAALTLALRELSSLPSNPRRLGNQAEERRSLRLPLADGRSTVAATLLALRSSTPEPDVIGPASRALLMIHQPGLAKEVDPGFLAAAFTFTPAEARMAARLAAGLSVDEIAVEFNVSVATIRTQLASVFDKTGTRRQAELVRLLLMASAF